MLLDALARAGYVSITSDTFTNGEGNVIAYKKAVLTHEGRSEDAYALVDVLLPSTLSETSAPGRRAARTSKTKTAAAEVALTPAQEELESKLRVWRRAEAGKTGKPAFIVLSDKVLRKIAAANPQSIGELLTISGIGPEKCDRYGAEIIAICRGDGVPVAPVVTHGPPRAKRAEPRRAKPQNLEIAASAPIETFHRPEHVADPSNALTPDQPLLDQRLRDWRKAESARLGAPPFLVLGSGALRAIVLKRPRTTAQLQSIDGITPDSARTHGPAILEICNA